ncbi:MAG: hypothetical protein Q9190_007402 [Brigantiaea leucoxantha]
MGQSAEPVETTSALSFRPAKRRKFYRKRASSENDDIATSEPQLDEDKSSRLLTVDGLVSQNSAPPVADTNDADTAHVSVAELLRRRAALRKRAGIEFTNSATNSAYKDSSPPRGDAAPDSVNALDKFSNVVDRFAPQRGLVADVDKHMIAYIDSELAKRLQGHDRSTNSSNDPSSSALSLNGASTGASVQRQPAALGKLHEIDLGPDATLTNIARTEAAKKRLECGMVETEEEGGGKVRLRRDGKPWRRRRRRNSDDIKRDKLVEEVMKESRRKSLIYDEPEVELPNDDQAADDRIAEQFRRDFMDAISSRRQRSSHAAKKTAGAKVDDKPRGPKLGGSRNARAAMREQQEKAAKK